MKFTASSFVYEESFTIRSNEIDNQKKITVPALVKLMQETAMQHVFKIKLSVWDLEKEGISWVLMRKLMHIYRLPLLGERIRIKTQPVGFEKVFTYRDYRVYDESNELVAYSSSTWLLMELKTRRMTRIPAYMQEFEKFMPAPEEHLPRPAKNLPKFSQVDQSKNYVVNWYDLDFNMHLNNTLYIQWMLETMNDELLQSGHLEEMDVQYKNECHWKDEVQSDTQRLSDDTYLHRLFRLSDGKELLVGVTKWST